MNPPTEDNYGCNYESLICLQSTPAVLALATQSGTIHHCLVLENEPDDGVCIRVCNNKEKRQGSKY